MWQNADGIFLEQGKYAIEILKRFKMTECKYMTTPMASNLKLLSDASSETVDAMMDHKLICSLMYLMNMRPDICFAHEGKMVGKICVECNTPVLILFALNYI